jgi:hypothetical protein
MQFCKGHTKDIASIAEHLPRLPEGCEIVLARKEGAELSNHIDFIVQRSKVLGALKRKIQCDPLYWANTLALS